MKEKSNLRVAIDAQVLPGTTGGVAQAVMSLVSGLGQLQDGAETYSIIVKSGEQKEWLKPFLGPNQQIVMKSTPPPSGNAILHYEQHRRPLPQFLKRSLAPVFPYLRYLWRLYLLKRTSAIGFPVVKCLKKSIKMPPRCFDVPMSDGFYESLGCQVLHIPFQEFVLSALPTIYNPHDLQHEHYPQFFSSSILEWRNTVYPAGCHLAHTVVVGSQWIKNDVVRCYGVSPQWIQVIPEAAPVQSDTPPAEEFLTGIVQKYGLERPFAFYPAVTWPHKQHIPLLEAIALLRDRFGMVVRLVCTGSRYEPHWPEIQACIDRLNLAGQVKFLGFVPDGDLGAFYHLAQFLVQPSLFEASSLPIFEAWQEGLPVACSNVSALPDQVKDAGLLFDPHRQESIAQAVKKMTLDSNLREELRKRGFRRHKDFDLERTSKALRAVYRRAGGIPLTEEDRWLLDWDWMLDPHRYQSV
ncbi:MAG: glycosyltransferase family 4 protein [Desulfuromonadaceae bacterium]|nr:glycosyltransferase family 4 protein [Desulfuromonadaceae bacterium]